MTTMPISERPSDQRSHDDWIPISSEFDSSSTLCDNCAKLDFSALLNKPMKPDLFYPVRNIGIVDKEPSATCSVCRLLADIWWMWGNKILTEGKQIIAGFVSSSNFRKYNHISEYGRNNDLDESSTINRSRSPVQRNHSHRPVLVLYCHISRLAEHDSTLPLVMDKYSLIKLTKNGGIFLDLVEEVSWDCLTCNLLEPVGVDMRELRRWMSLCQEHHKQCSRQPQNMPPGFRLIDCHSRHTFLADSQQIYAALSYPWGSAPGPPTLITGPLQHLPQTIEDSIQVTIQLGLKFLWVDRYCVPEDDNKPAQIRAMDKIYAGAEITLIQAHSSDPSLGLCGISHPRSRQPRVQIGKYRLVSSLPEPQDSIRFHSHWFQRAWTYQEAILSRRCLYFTEQQVYFECSRSAYQETLHEPDSLITSHIPPPIETTFSIDPYRMFPEGYLKQINDEPHLLGHRLVEYTYRELTYASDALNAFSGILNYFRHPTFNISHIFGIPILWSIRKQWSFVKGFAAGLSWEGYSTFRRHGFPSWSWAGWHRTNEGFGSLSDSAIYFHGIKCAPDLQFRFELVDGTILDWESYNCQSTLPDSPALKPILHVNAYMLRCKLFRIWNNLGLYIRIQNSLGCFWACSFICSSSDDSDVKEFIEYDECDIDETFPVPTRCNASGRRHNRPRWEEYKVNEEGICTSNGTFNDNLDSLDLYKEWPLLIIGDHHSATSTFTRFDEPCPDDCTKGPFLIVLNDKGGYYERLIGFDLSTRNVDNCDVPYPFGTDLSHYLADAKKCRIKLG